MSIVGAGVPRPTAPIKLYLSSNLITTSSISNALWMLTNLVVLSLRHEDTQESLDLLVLSFNFPVSFRVVCSG